MTGRSKPVTRANRAVPASRAGKRGSGVSPLHQVATRWTHPPPGTRSSHLWPECSTTVVSGQRPARDAGEVVSRASRSPVRATAVPACTGCPRNPLLPRAGCVQGVTGEAAGVVRAGSRPPPGPAPGRHPQASPRPGPAPGAACLAVALSRVHHCGMVAGHPCQRLADPGAASDSCPASAGFAVQAKRNEADRMVAPENHAPFDHESSTSITVLPARWRGCSSRPAATWRAQPRPRVTQR